MSPVRSKVTSGVAVLTIANPPVNALGAAVRGGLLDALTAALADPDVRAIVIAAEGKVFVAGADISEFGKPVVPPSLPDVLSAIESAPKPVVAAINGMALGGGLELALACHARIVAASAKLGLPKSSSASFPAPAARSACPASSAPPPLSP